MSLCHPPHLALPTPPDPLAIILSALSGLGIDIGSMSFPSIPIPTFCPLD